MAILVLLCVVPTELGVARTKLPSGVYRLLLVCRGGGVTKIQECFEGVNGFI